MSLESVVRNKVRKLLSSVDLDTTTQRTIQQQLEDDLGVDLDEYKDILKSEIDAFLLGQVDANAAQQQHQPAVQFDDGDDDEFVDTHPAKKRKQAAKPAAAPPYKAVAAPSDASEGPPGYSYSIPISSKRYLGVRVYNKRPMVDCREFYNDDSGAMKPGAKGLTFDPEQCRRLSNGLQAVNDAVSRQDETFFLDLGGNKRASVGSFHGKMMVSLREFYDKGNGTLAPGKKGISLAIDQWSKLCAAHEEITRALQSVAATLPAQSAPQAAISKPAGASSGKDGASGSGAVLSIELSSLRRAEVVVFKGKAVVDIREFYLKDGELCHGRKGLQLAPDQFAMLRDNAEAMAAALAVNDASFEIKLAEKRKASVSNFKGKVYADIREYYEKDGQLRPGQRGISLSIEQFDRLKAGLSQLSSALDAAQPGK